MSAFSFTAPICTPRQEKEERAALTDEERKSLHNEVYGREEVVEETEAMVDNGRVLFRQSLQSIPDSNKQAYLEALERAPLLIEKECDPVAFLRCEKFDALAAAKRLVDYWAMRKKLFGSERAFLPMTQAGAMAEDMEFLRKALAVALPDDDHERTVIGIDRIRCLGSIAPRDSILRCAFYTMQACADRESTQKHGYVLIINCRGYDLYSHFDRILSKRYVSILQCIPARMKGAHFITGSGKSVMEFVLPMVKHMAGRKRRLRIQLQAGSLSEVSDRLEDFGLGKTHVQMFYNILLLDESIENHVAWLNERRASEQGETH